MQNTGHHVTGAAHRAAVQPAGAVPCRRRERGAFAVMAAALVAVILGFCGFALDLSRMYNRKIELQTIADAVALAAAAQLNGTEQGIENALTAASKAGASYGMSFNYGKSAIVWKPDAIRFSAAPAGGPWIDATGAKAQAQTMFYVEVDTGRLEEGLGKVGLVLLPVLGSGKSAQTTVRAVAGRSTINVMPLALCAMSETRAAPRGDELVEHGFRRGVSYNLMKLNPNSSTTGANFLVNPVAPPGTAGTAVAARLNVIRPFVCTGTLAMPQVSTGNITVEPDFPLATVYQQLNSRFGSYTAPCTINGAPPDTNVREFTGHLSWMVDKPKAQSADSRTTATKLYTLADLAPDDVPADTTADLYGPLWIYAKAAKFAGYTNNEPEPNGYDAFTPSDWSTLYTPGKPAVNGTYPSPSPYKALSTSGGSRAVANRRVLNVPLLRCPLSSGSPTPAEVLAIGKFFMTTRATATELYGEFAGLAKPEQLGGQVELYP